MQTINTPIKAFQSVDGYTNSGTPLDGVQVTFSSDGYSQPINTTYVKVFSVQFTCNNSGSPNGAVHLEGSNDVSYHLKTADVGLQHWSQLSFVNESTGNTVQSVTVSGTTNQVYTIQVCSTGWVRLHWLNTSGTVTPLVRFFIKEQ